MLDCNTVSALWVISDCLGFIWCYVSARVPTTSLGVLGSPHGPLVASSHWCGGSTESPRRTSQTQEGGSTTTPSLAYR